MYIILRTPHRLCAINALLSFFMLAAENEVTRTDVQGESLTMTQCRTLRRYHAAKMIKDIPETVMKTCCVVYLINSLIKNLNVLYGL